MQGMNPRWKHRRWDRRSLASLAESWKTAQLSAWQNVRKRFTTQDNKASTWLRASLASWPPSSIFKDSITLYSALEILQLYLVWRLIIQRWDSTNVLRQAWS